MAVAGVVGDRRRTACGVFALVSWPYGGSYCFVLLARML